MKVSFAEIREDGTWEQVLIDVPDQHAGGVCPEHSACAWYIERAHPDTVQVAVLDWDVQVEELEK